MRPDGSGHDSQRQKNKSQRRAGIHQLVDVKFRRQQADKDRGPFPGRFFDEIHDPQRECHGKRGISHKTGQHVRGQPVALQGGNQRLNALIHPRGDGRVRHDQKSDGQNKNTDAAVLQTPLHEQIQKNNGPGEKNQRFVKIGKGRMTEAQIVRRPPAEGERNALRGKTGQRRPRGRLPPELSPQNHPEKIKNKSGKIEESHPA